MPLRGAHVPAVDQHQGGNRPHRARLLPLARPRRCVPPTPRSRVRVSIFWDAFVFVIGFNYFYVACDSKKNLKKKTPPPPPRSCGVGGVGFVPGPGRLFCLDPGEESPYSSDIDVRPPPLYADSPAVHLRKLRKGRGALGGRRGVCMSKKTTQKKCVRFGMTSLLEGYQYLTWRFSRDFGRNFCTLTSSWFL